MINGVKMFFFSKILITYLGKNNFSYLLYKALFWVLKPFFLSKSLIKIVPAHFEKEIKKVHK